MPWCPPELRKLKVRRVHVDEAFLTGVYSKLIGADFSGVYMGVYKVPKAHKLDEREVNREIIEVADEKMADILKSIHDDAESVTFLSGITLPTEKKTVWLWCMEPLQYASLGQLNRFQVTAVTFFKESEYRAEAEIQVEVVA